MRPSPFFYHIIICAEFIPSGGRWHRVGSSATCFSVSQTSRCTARSFPYEFTFLRPNTFSNWNEQRLFLYPVSLGALTSLYAGTAPEGVEFNGKVRGDFLPTLIYSFQILTTMCHNQYLSPWARLRYNRKDLDEEEKQEKLWAWCEREVKKFAP